METICVPFLHGIKCEALIASLRKLLKGLLSKDNSSLCHLLLCKTKALVTRCNKVYSNKMLNVRKNLTGKKECEFP